MPLMNNHAVLRHKLNQYSINIRLIMNSRICQVIPYHVDKQQYSKKYKQKFDKFLWKDMYWFILWHSLIDLLYGNIRLWSLIYV